MEAAKKERRLNFAGPLLGGPIVALMLLAGCAPPQPRETRLPTGPRIDATVERLMAEAHVPGMAVAVVRDGEVAYLHTYGYRNVESRAPLAPDTVMYAASLTKATFAYLVMQLVDEQRIDLDRPIADYLPKPLPDYPKYADLRHDDRWRKLTPRMLLDHTSGFPNFRFFTAHGIDENAPLAFAHDPGTRFGYSGEGLNLLQFVLETGLGLDVGKLMQTRVFDRFGMTRTGMTWRADFAPNLAIGYDESGKPVGYHRSSRVRAAGSMNTTPADYARFLAGLQRGAGLSAAARAEMFRTQVAIDSVQEFPTLEPGTTDDNRGIGLGYGLGWGVFDSPQGRAYFKEGHDDGTNNYVLCLDDRKVCLMLLANSSNGESIFKYLADAILGPTCLPWFWENYIPYDHPELREPSARAMPHPPCAPIR